MAKELTRRAAVEAEALAALFVEHGPALRRLVVGVLRDREGADDVVQATFAKAAAADIDQAGMKAWLYRVAFNEALTWKRRASVAHKAAHKLSQRAQRGAPTPDEELVRAETIQQVRDVLHTLPPEEREILRRRVYQQQTFAQIADEMGLPLGTVLTRARRALEKMRRKLKHDD